jgi:mannose-6-phosphate isomerase-like protein (cupin superfamily)
LSVDGEQFEFAAGDIVHLPPGSTHQVINDSAEDFEYYGIWWDTDMSAKFVTRHQDEA